MNVIAMPVRIHDQRITALRRAFGAAKFSLHDGAEVLGLSHGDAWAILFCRPLRDDAHYVSIDSPGFILLPTPPQTVALREWEKRYRPILCRLPETFSAQDFATAAAIPYPSANFLLGLFLAERIVEQHKWGRADDDGCTYRVRPKSVKIIRNVG